MVRQRITVGAQPHRRDVVMQGVLGFRFVRQGANSFRKWCAWVGGLAAGSPEGEVAGYPSEVRGGVAAGRMGSMSCGLEAGCAVGALRVCRRCAGWRMVAQERKAFSRRRLERETMGSFREGTAAGQTGRGRGSARGGPLFHRVGRQGRQARARIGRGEPVSASGPCHPARTGPSPRAPHGPLPEGEGIGVADSTSR